MNEESSHKAYEWAEEFFRSDYDVAPKYRDMLAMLAARMMGNPGAAQHFYNRAIVDGASDAELSRVVEIARSPEIEVGDLAANAKRLAEEIREKGENDDETGG